jgi:hypothetical protein
MKRLTVILLLTVQIGLLFNKSLTVLHFLLHRAEIIEHFCHHNNVSEKEACQGICYLNSAFEHHDKSNPQSFPVQSLIQQDIVFFEPSLGFSLKTPTFQTEILHNYTFKNLYFQNSFHSIWRPPTAA